MTVQQEDILELALIPFAVTPGYNIATAQGSYATARDTWFNWGTTSGASNYTHTEKKQHGVRTYTSDGTLTWLYSWTLTNLQLPANQTYYGTFYFADGTNSGELSWTQPGLNPNTADLVRVRVAYIAELARIADICTRGARQGWLSSDDYNGMKRAISLIQTYNVVKFNDGR